VEVVQQAGITLECYMQRTLAGANTRALTSKHDLIPASSGTTSVLNAENGVARQSSERRRAVDPGEHLQPIQAGPSGWISPLSQVLLSFDFS
jgi:hypothetical protein